MLQWVVIIGYFCLFCWIINSWNFFKKADINKYVLWSSLAVKFLASLVLYYTYTYYYPNRLEADIFKYFDDSAVMFGSLKENPLDYVKMVTGIGNSGDYFFEKYYSVMNNWERMFDTNVYNDSRTIIRFNAVMRIFSFGYFHVHSLFFCMLSLMGSVALFRAVKQYFVKLRQLLFILLITLPSILLWSSGVLKESILIFALGTMMYAFDLVFQKRSLRNAVPLILAILFLMFYIKFYVLVAFIPVMTCFVLANYFAKQKPSIVYLPTLIVFGLLAAFSAHIPPYMDLVDIIQGKQEDFIRLAEFQDAGSKFELTVIEHSFWGIIKVIPEGILNCFVRPLPTNLDSAIYFPALFENILIIGLILMVVWAGIKKGAYSKKEDLNFILFCITFTLILYAIIGVTTPVAGALVRYKVPALPFLIIALIYWLQNNKFLNSIESRFNSILG